MRRLLCVTVGLLAAIGVAAAAAHYVREPYNPGFARLPVTTAVHIGLGGLYLLLAPFQLVRSVRERSIAYHRRAGRILFGAGLLVGASALVISVAIPYSGWPERVIVGGFAIYFTAALSLAFRHVRAGRIDAHRAWMIRAFAIALSIATMRVLFIPALIAIGEPTVPQVQLLTLVTFSAGFVIHLTVAELWLAHTRQPALAPDRQQAGAILTG